MKWIPLVAITVLFSSCQTAPESEAPKAYAARADAEIAKYTITNNDVYGFEPEGKFDAGSVTILDSHKENDWTVYRIPDKKSGFDSAELTVDAAGTIVRLRFFKLAHTSVGRSEAVETAYQDLKSKYKAAQRTGDQDTEDLTVYVADNAVEWKDRYIAYLQLMDEPNKRSARSTEDYHLGAQLCWILQPHLSQIQAIVRADGHGASLTMDFQTKAYAAAIKSRTPPPKPEPQEP